MGKSTFTGAKTQKMTSSSMRCSCMTTLPKRSSKFHSLQLMTQFQSNVMPTQSVLTKNSLTFLEVQTVTALFRTYTNLNSKRKNSEESNSTKLMSSCLRLKCILATYTKASTSSFLAVVLYPKAANSTKSNFHLTSTKYASKAAKLLCLAHCLLRWDLILVS